MVACVFLWEWGISNFLPFGINVTVMRVYFLGAYDPVPCCFCGLSDRIKIMLWGYSCLMCFYSSLVVWVCT
jgi:hypothetical protein